MRLVSIIVVSAWCFWGGAFAHADEAQAPLWNKVCNKDAGGQAACAVEQFALAMPQKSVMAHVRFFLSGKADQTVITLQAPLGVLLPPGLNLSVDGSKPITLPFERCSGDGCAAVAVLDKAALAKFTGGKILTVSYTVAEKKSMDIPFKLDGLASALQSLSKPN